MKPAIRFADVPEGLRKQIYDYWLVAENNSYYALGKIYEMPHTMIGKIIEVEFSKNRKRRIDAD